MTQIQKLKKRAEGLCFNIISALAPHFNYAIEQAPKHVPCPIHGGKDGFRFHRDANKTGGGVCNTCGSFSDILSLLCWANDWTFNEAIKYVDEYLNGNQFPPVSRLKNIVQTCSTTRKKSEWKQRNIDQTYSELIPLSAPNAAPVFNYLNSRGVYDDLQELSDDIRCHPNLAYFKDQKNIGNMPALVSIVRNLNQEVVSLHRTYITSSGNKADVDVVRKLMSPSIPGATTGCAIQLFQATNKLVLAEGIETALALHLGLEMPAWSCLNSGGLEKVVLPLGVKEIVIGADNDQNNVGQKAASKLAERLLREDPTRDIRIITPPEMGTDWLDVYNQMEASK